MTQGHVFFLCGDENRHEKPEGASRGGVIKQGKSIKN